MNSYQWLTASKHTVSKREGGEQMNMCTSQNIEFKSLIVPKHTASTCKGDEVKTNYKKNFKKFRKVCLFSCSQLYSILNYV